MGKTLLRFRFQQRRQRRRAFSLPGKGRPHFKICRRGQKNNFLKKIEIFDPKSYTTKEYSILAPQEKEINGDTLRIFEIRSAIDAAPTVTHNAYAFLRNENPGGVIYGYFYHTFVYETLPELPVRNKIYETSKFSKPVFEDFSIKEHSPFVSVYDYEKSSVDIQIDLSKDETVRLDNLINDETKKFKKLYIRDKKGLREVFSK